MAKDITTISIPGRLPSQISKGHRQHHSGAGKHLDRRTKRSRTRSAAFRKVMEQS